jgi:hypothetical protein
MDSCHLHITYIPVFYFLKKIPICLLPDILDVVFLHRDKRNLMVFLGLPVGGMRCITSSTCTRIALYSITSSKCSLLLRVTLFAIS